MSSLGNLVVKVKADIANFTKGMGNVKGSLRTTESAAQKASRNINNAVRNFVSVAAITAVSSKIVSLATTFQDVSTRLRFMTGSTAAANREMEFLRATANAMSVDFGGLADANAKLISLENAGAVTTKERKELLIGLSEAQNALGVSNANMTLAYYSLGQALGSSNVQFDEIRDIIEKFPGLLTNLEKANGLATGSFKKMVAEGKIAGDQFASYLIPALKAYEGASAASFNNISASVRRFQNQMLEVGEIFQKPISPIMGASLDGLGNIIKGTADIFASTLVTLTSWVNYIKAEFPVVGTFFTDLSNAANLAANGIKNAIDRIAVSQDEEIQNQIKRVAKAQLDFQKETSMLNMNLPDNAFTANAGARRTAAFAKFKAEQEKLLDMQKKYKAAQEEATKEVEKQTTAVQKQATVLARPTVKPILAPSGSASDSLASVQAMAKPSETVQQLKSDLDYIQPKIEEVNSTAMQLGFTFSSAFEDAILNGAKFSDVLQGIGRDIAAIITRKTITEPFAGAVSGLLSGGGGGGGGLFGNLFGGMFGGGKAGTVVGTGATVGKAYSATAPLQFANGGRPPVGVPSIVGERGPELFVPDAAGTVVSHAKSKAMLSGGGMPAMNFNYTFGDGVQGATRAEILNALPSIVEASKRSVIEALNRGGKMSRAAGIQ